jgi:hypothetical protein
MPAGTEIARLVHTYRVAVALLNSTPFPHFQLRRVRTGPAPRLTIENHYRRKLIEGLILDPSTCAPPQIWVPQSQLNDKRDQDPQTLRQLGNEHLNNQ